MAVFLRVSVAAHALGGLLFWALQPRGFDPGSRSFFEHQVLAPLYFFCSLAAAVAPARRVRTRVVATGALVGWWLAIAGTTVIVGRGLFAAAFGLVAVGALAASALLVYKHRRVPVAGIVAGLLAGTVFLRCTWAPPASTRPIATPPSAAASTEPLQASLRGRYIAIGDPGDQVLVDPAFSFDSVSRSGYWTVFDFTRSLLPDWTVEERTPERLRLKASNADLDERVDVWSESGRVHIRATTRLARPVAAHLSSVMRIVSPHPAFFQGRPWSFGYAEAPSEFAAFREGRLQLLKAAQDEKGPFSVLMDLEPRDPVIGSGPWEIQVLGWAEQASRAESPTAGWGVSQGAIERYNGEFIWSLASTSVGRGWHAVRTEAGAYTLEAVIRRQP